LQPFKLSTIPDNLSTSGYLLPHEKNAMKVIVIIIGVLGSVTVCEGKQPLFLLFALLLGLASPFPLLLSRDS
jgi:hypothetical protein